MKNILAALARKFPNENGIGGNERKLKKKPHHFHIFQSPKRLKMKLHIHAHRGTNRRTYFFVLLKERDIFLPEKPLSSNSDIR